MYESFRSLEFLKKKTCFASALSSNNRVLRRNFIKNEVIGSYRSQSLRFIAGTQSLITTPRRKTQHAHLPTEFRSKTRLFGSKRGLPGSPLGKISIYNEQETIKDIDEDALRETVQRISKILGYETYDATLLLVEDEEMRETNFESRGINSPTDILSFPFHCCHENEAGHLEEPDFDIPDYYTLGDMVVCVPYVIRRCKEDLLLHNQSEMVRSGSSGETSQEEGMKHKNDTEGDFSLVEENDRGVSGAMAWVQNPEKRIRMLLVHGMLHLVGYDHIEDDDYIEMVEREEEILTELGEL
eukprot:CAMPEP_0197179104 /NCGR_PEP_ID=MMETSP1423-20130617/4166_1 /TAXON_ID=476441 /ORGANISM="Pseudo-nitzschia heimii, Strain UNC1101" /LENGTH=297 /DNA_ID=CAMNT_0042628967 /DNA_START=214 /DNA_END=1107 /DNA_ORIENTATION=+